MTGKKSTPVMKQFWDAKEKHRGSILLFRMGDFYETFENDAIITSEILGITLTKRANGSAASVPLAGFPYHSLDQHLHKLLKAGHRVAICEQVEDPKKSKGIVKREVVEVVSPGIAISDQFLNQKENNFLMCLFVVDNFFGFAILDHSTGEFKAGERSISKINTIIQQYLPSEILLPEFQVSDLKLHIKGEFLFTPYQEWMFDERSCYNRIKNHFKTQNLKGFGVENLKLAIPCCGVILDYLKKNCNTNINHITSLSIIKEKGYMNLDGFTIRNLELFQPLNSQNIKNSLIYCLDNTKTAIGGRLLKSWIRSPLAIKSKIEFRHNIIDEILNDKFLLNDIRNQFKNIADVERIISKLSVNRATPREVQQIGLSIQICNQIKNKIIKIKSRNLKNLFNNYHDIVDVSILILNNLADDLPVKISQGNVIKSGVNRKLDEIRTLQLDANTWLANYQVEEKNKTEINSLKIKYNKVFGYFIEVTKSNLNQVPSYYIRKQTLTNAERYFTPELKEFEDKILNANKEILEIETELFLELRSKVLEYSRMIQENAKLIAKLDVLFGFADLAVSNSYHKPNIQNSNILEIKNGRHPVIEQILPMDEQFIPNDVYLEPKKRQIALITGPNMSGKSTYLRQIALTVLMAQVGSYVPAESAEIGIVDQIFTRVGASDNLAAGESTFLVEMNETANILNNATKDSLIILDEIGRGTSTYDGLSIAWAIIEYIHNKTNISAKTIFATHYHELISLASKLPKAFNLNVMVQEFEDQIVFMRKIIEGGADKSYGVYVAELAGIPTEVIQRSKEILNKLNDNPHETIKASLEAKKEVQIDLFSKRQNEVFKDLKEIDINQITPLGALTKLNELKKKYEV
ncbi:MAG: DNA mismatch repair protein MutS [Candidatus Marinimicrobia bacterium]|nr:DNA mismatch repair protein MutS [Candidatus Neomarinimicrobiota bacterium]